MHQFTNDGLTFDVIDSGVPDAASSSADAAAPADAPASGATASADVPASGATAARSPRGTVVLLHGFPQTSAIWSEVTPPLNAAGLRTVAFDQRGYSPGARPEGRRNYRVKLLAGDVAALIDQLGDGPVHLVGHDWGAVVAWQLAATRPDLVATLTSLSVPSSGAFLKSMLSSAQLLRSWYMGFFQLPFVPEALATRAPFAFDKALELNGMTAEQIAAVHSNVIDTGAFGYAVNWYRALPFADPQFLRTQVTVPTAHVWGEGDPALDRRGAELAENYVVAPFELHVIGRGGHWLPENYPEKIAEIIIGLSG